MDQAEPDVRAYMSFPSQHQAAQHQSARAIEREIKRRTEVAGVSANEAAITPLVGAGQR